MNDIGEEISQSRSYEQWFFTNILANKKKTKRGNLGNTSSGSSKLPLPGEVEDDNGGEEERRPRCKP